MSDAMVPMQETVALPARVFTVEEMGAMAKNIVASGFFPGIKTPEAAVTLMMLCNAEGLHPVQALRRYDIIQGRPAMKSDAMLGEFQKRGGKVKWVELADQRVAAEFYAPGIVGAATVDWTLDRARKAGLTNKDNWTKYPRQMLRARVISEGVRMTMPGVNSGVYTPEEVMDFEVVESKPLEKPSPRQMVEEYNARKATRQDHGAVEASNNSPAAEETNASGVVAPAEVPAAEETPKPPPPTPEAPPRDKYNQRVNELMQSGMPMPDALAQASWENDVGPRPHMCTKKDCGSIVEEYTAKAAGKRPAGKYLRCKWAAEERAKMLAEGKSADEVKAVVSSHFYKWLGAA